MQEVNEYEMPQCQGETAGVGSTCGGTGRWLNESEIDILGYKMIILVQYLANKCKGNCAN